MDVEVGPRRTSKMGFDPFYVSFFNKTHTFSTFKAAGQVVAYSYREKNMAFVNLQIDLSELPIADELVMEPMAESYEREVKTQLLIIFLPILIASVLPFLLTQIIFLSAIPAVVLLLAILISTLVIRKAQVKGVSLREFDVAYRSGLFWRKTVIVAFNRVQHVEVSSGPLQRKFGLATVKFFTAGGSSVDLKVDGLSTERAEQIRTFIADKIDESINQ